MASMAVLPPSLTYFLQWLSKFGARYTFVPQENQLTWDHAGLYQANFFADRPTATGRYAYYIHS